MPPRLCGKGVGAEAVTVAGASAGNAENIRSVVAFFSALTAELAKSYRGGSGAYVYMRLSVFSEIASAIFFCIFGIIKGAYNIMKNTVFTGAATAIVTPLTRDGIDYEQFGRLIDWQIAEGIDAIVTVGTTGEGSTLTDEEHKEAIRFTVERVAGRVPVIAGTGSNDTAYAIELTKYAEAAGADAMLLVTPYYNKATQKGLIESFRAIADATTKPCILYNVPSRTGCNLLPASVKELAKHPNIVAIKEACGNISQIAELAALVGDEIDIYSGNDDQIVPIMSLGGKGVISVLSNIMPRETVKICRDFEAGNVKAAREAQLRLLPLINALFCEVNPIPAKAAVAAMGFCENYLRLPLTPMEPENEKKLLALMRDEGII